MHGTISPHSDEAGSSGHADVPKALAVDAASSDDLVGVAQPDVQQQQETWVKYNTLQEAQLLPEWRQQDSLMANATASCGTPHLSNASQPTEPALPLSASLKIVQAPAAYNRPIVQKKLFRPPFIVRLELRYQRQLDLVVTVIAHVLNDNQYAKPGTWQPLGGPGQADLEGHLLTRRLRVPTAFTAAEKQSQLADPDAHKMYAEDFEFSELNFVKSSRMSKRWLLFTCFFKEEPITVLYKLPTVIISRRTDQYSKAYENLMGQVPQQGIPRARVHALPKAPSGAGGSQLPSALQVLHQYHRSTEGGEGLNPTAPPAAPDNHDFHNRAGDAHFPTEAGTDAAHGNGMLHDQQIAAWILQHYASLGFRRALTPADLAALERRVRAGGHSPAVQPQAWHDFQDWFCKTMKALKQCEGEWNEARPPCMTGFAMDRAAADTALRYEPVGAFLIRMCSEPGLFAISCRTSSTDLQESFFGGAAAHSYASSDGAGSVDHMLLDCVDLQRRPLWHHVLACPAATHLLDPSSQRLYPKNQVHHQLAAQAGDPQPAPPPPTMDVDQLRTLAAHFQSHNTAALSNRPLHPSPHPHSHPHPPPHLRPRYAEPQVDPSSNSMQGGAPYPSAGPLPSHGGREEGHGNSGMADSGAQCGLTGRDVGNETGNVPNIQPRLQALLASLQAQVAGRSSSVQTPPARPVTTAPSQEEEEEDQSPQHQQAQQQQAQPQQAEQQQAPVGPDNCLVRPTDSTPGAVNATLQHLLQQSRASRNQCWHPDEGPQSDNLQNSAFSQERRNSISE